MIRRHLKKFFKILACIVLGTQVTFLTACGAPETPILHTTISADGRMVATLLHAGTDEQLLRVRNLETDNSWRTIQAPPLTRTIRFGLLGHELLLTHHVSASTAIEYLSKLDLDQPDKGLQKIYESDTGLAFPVEVTPGQVMVRTHRPPDPKTGKLFPSASHWILVGPGQQVQRVGPGSMWPYAAPNIVDTGFFWITEQVGETKDAHPLLSSYSFPYGIAPEFARSNLEKNTWTVDCDRAANRCLRTYLTNRDQIPHVPYVYDVDVIYGATRCKLPNVAGRNDGVSVTPDGSAAVMSLAAGRDGDRHVVVIHFNPQQCEAISVRHISFEQK